MLCHYFYNQDSGSHCNPLLSSYAESPLENPFFYPNSFPPFLTAPFSLSPVPFPLSSFVIFVPFVSFVVNSLDRWPIVPTLARILKASLFTYLNLSQLYEQTSVETLRSSIPTACRNLVTSHLVALFSVEGIKPWIFFAERIQKFPFV